MKHNRPYTPPPAPAVRMAKRDTYYDRIRNLPPEDLAEIIDNPCRICIAKDTDACNPPVHCKNNILIFLYQEVK